MSAIGDALSNAVVVSCNNVGYYIQTIFINIINSFMF